MKARNKIASKYAVPNLQKLKLAVLVNLWEWNEILKRKFLKYTCKFY